MGVGGKQGANRIGADSDRGRGGKKRDAMPARHFREVDVLGFRSAEYLPARQVAGRMWGRCKRAEVPQLRTSRKSAGGVPTPTPAPCRLSRARPCARPIVGGVLALSAFTAVDAPQGVCTAFAVRRRVIGGFRTERARGEIFAVCGEG